MITLSDEEFAVLSTLSSLSARLSRSTTRTPKKTSRVVKQPPAVPHEKETAIQNRIRDFLRMHGWYVMRHQQSLGSLKGMSDLTAIKDGKTIYVEVKTPRGHQSQYQKEFQREIESHGGTYILARGIEDVEQIASGKV